MRVFVTGHRGYIGCHLVDLLKQAGHKVTGCDLRLRTLRKRLDRLEAAA